MSIVTAAEVKSFLEISHTRQDTIIDILIAAVEAEIEKALAIKLESESRSDYCDGGKEGLWVPFHPLTAVTTITDRLNQVNYTGTTYHDEYKIWTAEEGELWERGSNRWTVTYTCGFTEATLPAGLKLEILNMIHRAYNNRGGIASEGAEGANINYQNFMDADFMKRAASYNYNLPFA